MHTINNYADHRAEVLRVFYAALTAVNGGLRVRECLARRVFDGPVYLVAIGKAATSMTEGALEVLGEKLAESLLITKADHLSEKVLADKRIICMVAGHPVPDERSIHAGKELLRFLADIPPGAQLVFLLSGGASALVEVLKPGVTLAQWRGLNEWLLASGRDIVNMNRMRRAVSTIKGGGLLAYLPVARKTVCLMISDVKGDDPRVIGSGLLFPSADVTGFPSPGSCPDWIRSLMAQAIGQGHQSVPTQIDYEIVAGLNDAVSAAASVAAVKYQVYRHEEFIDGDALLMGQHLAQTLLDHPPGLHVWGGETTVVLPEHPGRGGRNQAFALAAAQVLRGRDGVLLLAAGSDGSDGPGGDAGALVDGGTLDRGALAGFDASACLAGADAGCFLEASGDLLTTGPTGTNVMDLMIGLRWE